MATVALDTTNPDLTLENYPKAIVSTAINQPSEAELVSIINGAKSVLNGWDVVFNGR